MLYMLAMATLIRQMKEMVRMRLKMAEHPLARRSNLLLRYVSGRHRLCDGVL